MITEVDRIIALCFLMSEGPPAELADKFTVEQIKATNKAMWVTAIKIADGLHNQLTDNMVRNIFKDHGHG